MKTRGNPAQFLHSPWKAMDPAKVARWSGTHLLLAGIIFFASWLRFPNFLFGSVDYLEHAYFDLAGRSISSQVHPDLRIIYIEEKEKNDPWYFGDEESRRRWRVHHAKLLQELAKAGAKIVAFDFAFPESSPFDSELAEAIRNANAGKTRVIIGYIPEPGQVEPKVSQNLKAVLGSGQLASIRVGIQKKGSPYFGYVLLARSRPMAAVKTAEAAFPLQIKLAWESLKRGKPVTASLDEVVSQLFLHAGGERIETIPCQVQREDSGGVTWLTASLVLNMADPDELDAISRPYDLVQSWIEESPENLASEYEGKVVLVGAQIEKENVPVAPNEKRFGYQIHASVVNDLLRGVYPHEWGILGQFAVLFLLCLGAGLVRAAFPQGSRPISISLPIPLLGRNWDLPLAVILLLGVYVSAAVLIYARTQLLLDVVYQGVALVAGYYVTGWMLMQPPGPPGRAPRAATRTHRRKGTP